MKTQARTAKEKKDLTAVTVQMDAAMAREMAEIATRTDTSEAAVYRGAVRMALAIWKKQPHSLMEALTNHPISCVAS